MQAPSVTNRFAHVVRLVVAVRAPTCAGRAPMRAPPISWIALPGVGMSRSRIRTTRTGGLEHRRALRLRMSLSACALVLAVPQSMRSCGSALASFSLGSSVSRFSARGRHSAKRDAARIPVARLAQRALKSAPSPAARRPRVQPRWIAPPW